MSDPRLDPAVALAIGVVIGYQAIRLLWDAFRDLRGSAVTQVPPRGWQG
jgi:divalent metal cation (Fe/Co/Zn/Cd) transporter